MLPPSSSISINCAEKIGTYTGKDGLGPQMHTPKLPSAGIK
jgi:hypothetical protein